MAIASGPWRSERRTAACFAFSVAAHALALVAAVPALSVVPRALLPALDVRLVSAPPAPAEAVPETPAPQPVEEPPVEVLANPESKLEPPAPAPVATAQEVLSAAASKERVAPERPQPPAPAADVEPQGAEAPLTEQEKARLNPRYLAEAEVERKATALDEARAPDYPPEALRDGITGCVLVMVYVGAGGTVEDVDVIRSDPPRIFDRAAMRSFISKRYLPAIKANAPVRVRVPGVASFELEGRPQPYCALRYYPLVRELNGDPITLTSGKDGK